jgi:hypothetical protein
LKQTNFPKTSTKNGTTVTQDSDTTTHEKTDNITTQRQVSWDGNTLDTGRSPGSSLSRSITNSKIQNFKKDIDAEIQELKNNLKNRMDKQDQRIQEMIDVIHSMNKDLEHRMASAVITTLVREKAKVQEFTHGRTFSVAEAPLADENGRLPYGPIAQSGGPLDRLHHVEVTVQHMAAVLDTIADHLQLDPMARHFFRDDSDEKSETSTIIENRSLANTNAGQTEAQDNTFDNDVPMQMIRDFGGVQRLHGTDRSPSRERNHDTNIESSPQATPPPKRE